MGFAESESVAKKLKASAEQRAEKSRKPGDGVDIDHVDIVN